MRPLLLRIVFAGWLATAAAIPVWAQELVWVPPVAASDAQPPSADHLQPWTPYRGPEQRIELLPPVEFNLEQDSFASEPIADLDPVTPGQSPRKKSSFGRAAPVSLGGFWAPNTPVVGQPTNLQMNAQFARVAMPLGIPEEGKPLWLAIAKFGRLELATDAILPDSGQRVPGQFWLVETGVTHIHPLASGSTLGGTFLFGSASDKPFHAGRDLTLMPSCLRPSQPATTAMTGASACSIPPPRNCRIRCRALPMSGSQTTPSKPRSACRQAWNGGPPPTGR